MEATSVDHKEEEPAWCGWITYYNKFYILLNVILGHTDTEKGELESSWWITSFYV